MVNGINEIEENILLLHRPEKLTYKTQIYYVMEICTNFVLINCEAAKRL